MANDGTDGQLIMFFAYSQNSFSNLAPDVIMNLSTSSFRKRLNDIEVHFTNSFQNFMPLPVEK